MHHLYNTETGSIIWSGSAPYSVDGQLVDLPANLVRLTEIIAPQPELAAGMTADSTTVIDTQAGTITRGWTVRPKTDAEAQTVSTQLILYSGLTAAERRNLRALANTEGPAGDVALQIEGAFYSAVETESRNPQTKMLIGAAMQLGIIGSIERARELLNDPGFTLE